MKLNILLDYKRSPNTIKVFIIVLFLALLISLAATFRLNLSYKNKPVAQTTTTTKTDLSILSEKERITELYGLPVMLPTSLSSYFNEPVYVYEDALWGTGYNLSIDAGSKCDGADSCNLASVTMNRYTPLDFTAGTQVKLANNTTGYYSPLTCGGSCDDAMIIWRSGDYDVSAGVHSGTEDEVVKLSNFIISNPTQ